MTTTTSTTNTPYTATGAGTELDNTRRSMQQLSENFDNFLKLLTTQLQHQDPTQPLDTNEFTNQIVQFSNLEQTVGVNDNLKKMITQNTDLSKAISDSSKSTTDALKQLVDLSKMQNPAVSYVGKIVEAEGNIAELKGGEAHLHFINSKPAVVSTITIKDQSGKVVYTERLNNISGRHEYVWNGKDSAGKKLPDGVYNFSVNSIDANGTVDTLTLVSGKVDAAQFYDGESLLEIGKILVPLSSVAAVREAPLPS